MAAIKILISVERLSNVLLQFDRIKVYRSITGSGGTYAELTSPSTRIELEIDVTSYEFIDTSGEPTHWYRTSYYHSVSALESSLSDPRQGADSGGLYCTVDDLRAEGVTIAMLSDARALEKIRLSGAYIERVTGYWFEPRLRTFRIRGEGAKRQRLPHPIIRLDEVALADGAAEQFSKSVYDLSNLIVYNRHLTQGLLNPDDRRRPMLEVVGLEAWWAELGYFPTNTWVQVTGLWGFTELPLDAAPAETYEGSQIPTSHGSTPALIVEVAKRLVIREVAQLADVAGREDARWRHRIIAERTRSQSYQMESLTNLARLGGPTGDPDIDEILVEFLRPRSSAEVV